MVDSDINNYPSAAVRQYPIKNAFLIDCDGGLYTAFHSKGPTVIKPDLIKCFPSNSDIFLFFNSNVAKIVKQMKNLKLKYPNVHTFPNIIKNSKNGADMNLSFILGAINNNKYDTYVIIARHDKGYNEIQKRLENTHPRLKNHVELRRFNGPKELAQYVQEMDKDQNEEERFVLKTRKLSPTKVQFTSENLFRRCPLELWQRSSRLYRFAELVDHLDSEHPSYQYHYCPTCEEMVDKNYWSKDQRQVFDEHFEKEHMDNNAGFCLSIWSP